MTLIQANSLQIPLASRSVQMVVTSPPYWGLRAYATGDQKHAELGAERLHDCLGWATGANCGECYVCHMRQVAAELRRVLRDDGVMFINLGDSYANNGVKDPSKVGGFTGARIRAGVKGIMDSQPKEIQPGLKPKDLCGIPWRVALALQADGWYLRSEIIWAKPNPMPESVTDRPTKAHEQIFLLTKRERYYWDQEAIREPYSEASLPRALRGLSQDNKWNNGAPGSTAHTMSQPRPNIRKKWEAEHGGGGSGFDGHSGYVDENGRLLINPSGRNPRTVWQIPTQSFGGAHFATFPIDIPLRAIKAGTPERGCCPICGAAWVRVVDRTPPGKHQSERQTIESGRGDGGDRSKHAEPSINITVGWQPACTCPPADPIPALVLDPFNGAATTGLAAAQLGRRYVGLDLSAAYLRMSRDRLGIAALNNWTEGEAQSGGGDLSGLPLFGDLG